MKKMSHLSATPGAISIGSSNKSFIVDFLIKEINLIFICRCWDVNRTIYIVVVVGTCRVAIANK